jgi:hypothetical protein
LITTVCPRNFWKYGSASTSASALDFIIIRPG